MYDHRCFNDFLEYPSVENICEMIHQKLEAQLSMPCTVRVWEGNGKWAEV
jgi:6-pyruvoyltetrahydropterin/6-carboxytetrahydropterin synthase